MNMGDKMIDNKIFSKVFFWMFIGLAITFGVGYYVSLNEKLRRPSFSNGGVWGGL